MSVDLYRIKTTDTMAQQNHHGCFATTYHEMTPTISPYSTTYSTTSSSSDPALNNSTPQQRVELDWEILNNPAYLDDYDFNYDFSLFPVDTPLDAYDSANFFPQLEDLASPAADVQPSTAGHRCSYCSEAFEKRHELNRHLLKHTKPYTCPVSKCLASFAEKRGCDRHVKSRHTWPTRKDTVNCRYCKYSSTRADAVQRHLRTQHGVTVSFKLGNSPATT